MLKQNSNRKAFYQTILKCFSLSWNTSKIYTILRLFLEISTPILTTVNSLLVKKIIDLLSIPIDLPNKSLIITTLIYMSFISLLRSIFLHISQHCTSMHEDIINNKITLESMDIALKADLEYFDNPDYYNKIHSIYRDYLSVSNVLWHLISLLSSSISLIIIFALLVKLNLLASMLLLLASVPSAIVEVTYSKALYSLNLKQIKGEREKAYLHSLCLSKGYAQDLRLYSIKNYLKKKHNNIFLDLFKSKKALVFRKTLLACFCEILPGIVLVFIGLDIILKIINGSATTGDYLLYTTLGTQLLTAFIRFSDSVVQIFDNRLKFNNIISLSDYSNKVTDNGELPLDTINTISFENVSFKYPLTEKNILSNISFSVSKEEKVGIVGINGSGKSTLIKLLLRFYDPDEGLIKINGIDIKDYKLSELRKNFSVYFQEMKNYCFSIKENITLSDIYREDVDDGIKYALSTSCNSNVFNNTRGIHSNISKVFDENGIELSIGQHQKLSLGRAFYRRCSVIILDEPSSSLDPQTEHELFKEIRKYSEDKMTIFTSHRLSNTFLASRIIVIENGKIIEDGTQEELLNNQNRYAQLFNLQKSKYQI